MLKIGFIGAGIVGTALAQLLSSQGYRIVAVSSRNLTSAENLSRTIKDCCVFNTNQEVADAAGLIFITIPDDAIAPAASQVQTNGLLPVRFLRLWSRSDGYRICLW